MGWSYKPLWHLLIEHDIKKTELIRIAGLNSYTVTCMSKNEPVSLTALGKLCKTFNCTLNDLVEYVPDE